MNERKSLIAVRPSGATCAACVTASTGGTCPNCGLYWYRNKEGKIVGVRLEPQIPQPPTTDAPEFWRSPPSLETSIARARQMDQRFAEAVNALGHLWNVILFKLLTGQQATALVYCHTRRELTSAELAGALKVSRQQASNVLRDLVTKGLLTYSKRSRTRYYEVAVLWPTGTVSTAAQIVVKGLLPTVEEPTS